MKRLAGYIRRHPRLWAGGAAVLLAGVALLTLRSAGPAHAAPGAAQPSTSSHAVASARVPRSSGPARIGFATVTVGRATPARPAGHVAASARSGIPAATPNSTELAQALRRATGLSPAQVTTQSACPPAAQGHARCAAEVLVVRANHALVRPRAGAPASAGPAKPATGGSTAQPQLFTPQYLQQAYDLSYLSQAGGKGDTVAIVDVGDDPRAATDLATYRQAEGLPACSACFQKVNQTGGTSWYPQPAGWDVEESLDIDAVSAICPNCHILLVEASSSALSDLHTAMVTAHNMGANQISDSWTDLLSSAPTGTYAWSGTATVAATGDAGYLDPGQDNYPAALPGVTAAGGTTLSPAGGLPNLRGFGEGAWSGAGSGCDLNQAKPAGQTDTGCSGRSYADVSAAADPSTGLNVYDSASGGWVAVGGTSLATPLIAAYYALTGIANSSPHPASPQWAYTHSGLLNDITSGSNGSCDAAVAYICSAGPGYDGPTGVGSISGAVIAGAPGIGAPSVPTATANTYTTSVRSDGATITGGIYPNGLATQWWINYWPANGAGSVQQTAAANIGSGTAVVAVTGYPSHLASGTTYNYQLVAKNADGTAYGYTSSFTTSAASPPPPTAAFTPAPATSIPNAAINFDASASTPAPGHTITSYSWDFGDPGSANDTATGATASHSYATPGQYNVTLVVTDSDGQTESTTQTVTVDAPPSASFTTPSTSPGPSVSFDASGSSDSVGTIKTYSWSVVNQNPPSGPSNSQIADNNNTSATSTGSSPTYTLPLPRGSYTVTLTVTNDAGETTTTSQTVTVDDPPTSATTSFTPSATVVAPGTTVNWNAAATSPDAALGGSIAGYSWSFGDGSTGTTANGSHVYASPGTYPVSLTVTDDLGQSYTTPAQIVTVDATPTAAFTTSSNPAPGKTSFDASSSSDSFGTITDYAWHFIGPSGSGSTDTTATGPNPTPPLARGTYTVSLTVTNDAGQVSPATTQTVTVDDPPTASLAPSTRLTTPGSAVSFGATATSPDVAYGGSIAGYSWNFGDGNTSGEQNPSHAYATPGTYPVSLTVTDDLGQSYTTPTQSVTVDATPTAAFTASATLVTAGSAVGFNAGGSSDSVGTITGYSWDFGDGATATGQAASHVYASPGTYPVSLTVTNDAGQTAVRTAAVTVNSVPSPVSTPAPSPNSTPAPAPAPAPMPLPLSAALTGVKKAKLAAALAHGMRVDLAINQAVTASFKVTLPVLESKLAGSHRPKTSAIVLLRLKAQALAAGSHAITLKLSRAAARELAGTGPLTLTVQVTLTDANGATGERSVKLALTR